MGDDDITSSIFVCGLYIYVCGGDIGFLFSWVYRFHTVLSPNCGTKSSDSCFVPLLFCITIFGRILLHTLSIFGHLCFSLINTPGFPSPACARMFNYDTSTHVGAIRTAIPPDK